MPGSRRAQPVRQTYRHGNLRQALVQAGVQLAREGGPQAVALREATRRAGVVPNAAYRHFSGQRELLDAVRTAALSQVARAMETELALLGPERATRTYARAALRAIGKGYLGFALAETGLFRTAFVLPFTLEESTDPAKAGASGLDPFELLGSALDRLVAVGLLPRSRRPHAEFLAWSAVHGMAMLAIDGPLRVVPGQVLQRLARRLLEMVEKGL